MNSKHASPFRRSRPSPPGGSPERTRSCPAARPRRTALPSSSRRRCRACTERCSRSGWSEDFASWRAARYRMRACRQCRPEEVTQRALVLHVLSAELSRTRWCSARRRRCVDQEEILGLLELLAVEELLPFHAHHLDRHAAHIDVPVGLDRRERVGETDPRLVDDGSLKSRASPVPAPAGTVNSAFTHPWAFVWASRRIGRTLGGYLRSLRPVKRSGISLMCAASSGSGYTSSWFRSFKCSVAIS